MSKSKHSNYINVEFSVNCGFWKRHVKQNRSSENAFSLVIPRQGLALLPAHHIRRSVDWTYPQVFQSQTEVIKSGGTGRLNLGSAGQLPDQAFSSTPFPVPICYYSHPLFSFLIPALYLTLTPPSITSISLYSSYSTSFQEEIKPVIWYITSCFFQESFFGMEVEHCNFA